ncbi:MAG TPA: hypothetical protein VEC36_13910 [Patescibacteria group bacterium]|nr:hypothetical protein [Patescibacteria group bacterium]
MKKSTVFLILIIGLPLSFFAGFQCNEAISGLDAVGKPTLNFVKLHNPEPEPLFLISKRWGITGNHQIYALTKTEPNGESWHPDSLKDVIWKGEPTIFYQVQNDSIIIFTTQLPDNNQRISTKSVVDIQLIDNDTRQKFLAQKNNLIRLLN